MGTEEAIRQINQAFQNERTSTWWQENQKTYDQEKEKIVLSK